MFDKLDAYNLVANLVPGAALSYALHYSGYPIPSPHELGAFLLVAFVVGVTANRLGSLCLDPLLRSVSFLEKKDYDAFVTAEEKDPKLETLVANAGLYRTFFTSGFLYFFAISIDCLVPDFPKKDSILSILAIIAGMIVFLYAFRKEDGYIKSRLRAKATAAGRQSI
ncbi:hypothetical protein [Croceicoccus sediminis]|uniref:hypothetical protein n=1 Tax=Croceicoccus sediminis TaxID=2571150 RepID=UPI00118209A5|nr:hypothetical protein [Croceicoccus sediminis]